MSPRDVDAHSFRDLWVMIGAARDREEAHQKEEWRRTLILTQSVMNTHAKQARPLDHLAKKILDHEPINRPSLAEYKAIRDRAVKLTEAKNGNDSTCG